MAVEAYYFSHDYSSRSDRKMIALQMELGMTGVGIYWCLIEMLYEQGGYLKLQECNSIAFELRQDADSIQKVIRDFELFKFDSNSFWSESVLRRMAVRAGKSEIYRNNAKKRWDNAIAIPLQSNGNARKGKESITKQSKGERESKPQAQIFGKEHSHFIIVKPKYITDPYCRIYGKAGLMEYLQASGTILNMPEYGDKFMRNNNGKVFNEFSHVQNSYNQFIEKQGQNG